MNRNIIHCAQNRAYIAGAEARALELQATALQTRAIAARRRYCRELEAIVILMGDSPSPFAGLG